MKILCKYDELLPLHKIIPNPKNPNEHSTDSTDFLAKNIDYQGIRWPIIISNRSGFIAAGHGRLYAAQQLKYASFPVVYQDFETEAQEYEFLVADNKLAEFSSTNEDLVLKALKDLPEIKIDMLAMPGLEDSIDDEAVKEGNTEDDAVPEVEDNPYGVKRGDIWVLGDHRVMCGDSTSKEDVDKLMGGEKVDMVFTDPPYGVALVKTNGNNNSLGDSLGGYGVKGACKKGTYKPIVGDDSNEVAIKTVRLIEDMDSIKILWGANYYSSALADTGAWLCWDKDNGEGFFADGELAWTNTSKTFRIFKHQWKGMIKASEHGQARVHPTQKPIALAEWCFESYGGPNSVLDLFLGSGSTLIACEKTNRKCYGMEIDEHYVSVIIKRWEDFTGLKARRITTAN
jgi:hypothetical protein